MTGYVYDAEGRRVAKGTITTWGSCETTQNGFVANSSGTTVYYLGPGGEQLSEVDGTGAWKHTNVYAAGSLIATYDPQGLHYHLTGPLGSRRVQTNAQGAVEQTFVNLPYGEMPAGQPLGASEHHFTGKERDQESGNDYFGARYYASSMGRFLSPDWASNPQAVPYASYANPQTLNLYGYMRNNPFAGIDKDGHCGGTMDPCREADNADVIQQHSDNAKKEGQQQSRQPAPTNPDGSPKSPQGDVPNLPDGKGPDGNLVPNQWVPGKGTDGRGTKWGPKYPIPGQSQPNTSWDPNGHWDHNDGNGNRTRWLPNGGGQVDHDNNPVSRSMMGLMKSITPGPILKLGTAGVITYIIIDEGSRLYPPRNFVPVP